MIPNLPTDNLYKFLALFGLIVVALSFIFPYRMQLDLERQEKEAIRNYSISTIKLTARRDEASLLVKELSERNTALEKSIEAMDKKKDALTAVENQITKVESALEAIRHAKPPLQDEGKRIAIYQDQLAIYRNLIEAHNNQYKQLSERQASLAIDARAIGPRKISMQEELQIMLAERKMLMEVIASRKADWEFLQIVSIVSVAIGTLFMIFGFTLWYHKLQKYQDIAIKRVNTPREVEDRYRNSEPGSY